MNNGNADRLSRIAYTQQASPEKGGDVRESHRTCDVSHPLDSYYSHNPFSFFLVWHWSSLSWHYVPVPQAAKGRAGQRDIMVTARQKG